jgi:hypothetical protein
LAQRRLAAWSGGMILAQIAKERRLNLALYLSSRGIMAWAPPPERGDWGVKIRPKVRGVLGLVVWLSPRVREAAGSIP